MSKSKALQEELAKAERKIRKLKKKLAAAISEEYAENPLQCFMAWAESGAPTENYYCIEKFKASSGRELWQTIYANEIRGVVDIDNVSEVLWDRWNYLEDRGTGDGPCSYEQGRLEDGSWGSTDKIECTKQDLIEWMQQLIEANFNSMAWDW